MTFYCMKKGKFFKWNIFQIIPLVKKELWIYMNDPEVWNFMTTDEHKKSPARLSQPG